MPAASSDDARGASPAASVLAPSEGETEDPHISAYVAHLAHVGDEMAPGLGALFADTFPAVPALADIHEDFTFSKNDSLLLFAGLDGNALTLAQAQAAGGTASEMINRVLGHIADLHGTFLAGLRATDSEQLATASSNATTFSTPAPHPAQSGGERRGAGQGAHGGQTPGAPEPVSGQNVFLNTGGAVGVPELAVDGQPGGSPVGTAAVPTNPANPDLSSLRGNSQRLKAEYEASLRAISASTSSMGAGLNPVPVPSVPSSPGFDLSLPLALRSVARSPSVPAAVRQDSPAQLVPPAAVGAAPAAAPAPAPVVAAPN